MIRNDWTEIMISLYFEEVACVRVKYMCTADSDERDFNVYHSDVAAVSDAILLLSQDYRVDRYVLGTDNPDKRIYLYKPYKRVETAGLMFDDRLAFVVTFNASRSGERR